LSITKHFNSRLASTRNEVKEFLVLTNLIALYGFGHFRFQSINDRDGKILRQTAFEINIKSSLLK